MVNHQSCDTMSKFKSQTQLNIKNAVCSELKLHIQRQIFKYKKNWRETEVEDDLWELEQEETIFFDTSITTPTPTIYTNVYMKQKTFWHV